MCGIVAIHDRQDSLGEDPAAVGARMLARLRHRGPDGSGQRQIGDSWLGHARLSIVDLAEGAQPIESQGEYRRRFVVANGEIYNHEDLRLDSPHPFRTRSDSEAALVATYTRDAAVLDANLARLRGMFAFAVADEDGGFLAVRDPLGVKPLYWARVDGATLFASELSAFDIGVRSQVREFPPGFRWTPAEGLVRFRTLQTGESTMLREDRARIVERVRDTLIASVRARMMADVPVGVFLSGGLDSSLVAAIMVRYADPVWGPVCSFAAGTAGSSDLEAARRVADHLGLRHREIVYTGDDVVAALPSVVHCMESYEPSLVRSAVPNYLLARETAKTIKVVLTGEGADELFAGYAHLRDIDEALLADELIASVAGLHNLNLQRCDRVTMAHGVEARVPFLDRAMVNLAQRIPIQMKLPGQYGQEKAILREAFAGWLPEDLLWRPKEQFGDGSGTAHVMSERVAELAPEEDWADLRVPGLPAPRSREELAYQRLFADHLAGVDASVLGRFATA